MKKILAAKVLPLAFVAICFLVSFTFYKKDKISFLPQKKPATTSNYIGIPYAEKEYKLSYGSRPLTQYLEICRFEEGENWQGNGEMDFETVLEGKNSLLLNSQNNDKAIARLVLREPVVIEGIVNFRLFVNQKTKPDNIESLELILTSEGSGNKYTYPLRELREGWNLLSLPLEKFSVVGGRGKTNINKEASGINSPKDITEISFELTSRPRTLTSLNFDFFWGEKDNSFLQDWIVNSPSFLSTMNYKAKPYLMVLNYGADAALLRKIGTAGRYSFQARFIPLAKGGFGFYVNGNDLNGFGYYLSLDGIGTSGWKIVKYGLFDNEVKRVTLTEGRVNNFSVVEGEQYYLKVKVGDSRLSFFISLDGKDFINLGETSDNSYSSGGVGIFASGGSIFLIDDLYFSQ